MKHFLLALIAFVLLTAVLAAAPGVTITSPNGGEVWAPGSAQNITWTSTEAGSLTVNITLRNAAGKVGDIKNGASLAAGSWNWASVGKLADGTVVPAGSGYTVRINIVGLNTRDDSNAPFTIGEITPPPPPPPGGDPTLVLTAPNGGGKWPSGEKRLITWTAANWSGLVSLSLFQNGVYKGAIATDLPSASGSFEWLVGSTNRGSAGLGEGYIVRVTRVYKGLTPLKTLADDSDVPFAIGFSRDVLTKAGIRVTLPGEGQVYEYGFAIYKKGEGQGRAVKVPVEWSSDSAGPFEIYLHNVANKNERLLLTQPGAGGTGIQTYKASVMVTEANSDPGFYKIRVKCADNGGFSGRFELKYKLIEVTLEPSFSDRYYYASKDYSLPGDDFIGHDFGKIDASKPGNARVGFRNYLQQESGSTSYNYKGYLYRSVVKFDLSQFKNRKGYFSKAKIKILRVGYAGAVGMDQADCCTQVHILAEPWPGSDFLAIPGNLIQNYPTGNPTNFDIPDWAAAWASGSSPNHGMLISGTMQSMNHDNLFCVNYYSLRLEIQFQETE